MQAVTFHRVPKPAEAIRFVMEKSQLEMLHGTVMEIGERRSIGIGIRRLQGTDDH